MLEKLNPPKINKRYRFKILKGQKLNDGSIEKQHQVGVALLNEGQSIYTIHLYVFQNNPFFLVGHKQDPEKYYVMTRRAKQDPHSKQKFSWNIVGHAKTNVTQSCLELYFDLFPEPIFMNLFPEERLTAETFLESVA